MSKGFDVVSFVGSQIDLFNQSLSTQDVSWAQEQQFAIQAFQRNDYLATVARNNPQSAQNAIINVAAIGITLNPASKLAYLVPRDKAVILDISYMGLLHIAMSTGSIMWGQCKLVHDGDHYESNGLDKAPTHKYNAFKDRGSVIGGYCTVKTADGDYLTEEMSADEINAIRDRSQGWKSGKNTPWKTDWSEMARKTIVKRASKYWPKVDRLDKAIHFLNTDGGEGLQETDVTPCTEQQQLRIDELMRLLNRNGDQLMAWLSKACKRDLATLDQLTEFEAQKAITSMEGMLNENNKTAS